MTVTPNDQGPNSRREAWRLLARKLSRPAELSELLRYKLRDGNEYPYFDFADFFPDATRVLQHVGPTRLDFDRPVFLAGLRRSGTTLFYRMMNAHTGLSLFNERFPGDRMHGYGYCTWDNVWAVEDPEEIRGIARRYLSPVLRWRRGRWGVKLCLQLVHPDARSVPEEGFWRLSESFPKAHFLAIVRDPRDFVISAVRRGGFDDAFWSEEYVAALELFDAARLRLPGRFDVLRYEDLVHAPEATLVRCCDSAGLDYQPGMLDPARWSRKGPKEYEREGIRAQTAKWKRSVEDDPGRIQKIEELCFPAAARVGYERP